MAEDPQPTPQKIVAAAFAQALTPAAGTAFHFPDGLSLHIVSATTRTFDVGGVRRSNTEWILVFQDPAGHRRVGTLVTGFPGGLPDDWEFALGAQWYRFSAVQWSVARIETPASAKAYSYGTPVPFPKDGDKRRIGDYEVTRVRTAHANSVTYVTFAVGGVEFAVQLGAAPFAQYLPAPAKAASWNVGMPPPRIEATDPVFEVSWSGKTDGGLTLTPKR